MMMRRILATAVVATFVAACAGPPGPPGPSGPPGPPGQTVQQPSTVMVPVAPIPHPATQRPAPLMSDSSSFGDFWFMPGSAEIQPSDRGTVYVVADHMRRNPGHEVGIDGYADPNDYALSERRVIAVRDALIEAGVPADRISIGSFGNPQLRRDQRVEVLLVQR